MSSHLHLTRRIVVTACIPSLVLATLLLLLDPVYRKDRD